MSAALSRSRRTKHPRWGPTPRLASLRSVSSTLLVVVIVAALLALTVLVLAGRALLSGRPPPGAVIGEARSLTSLDDETGAVRSLQSAVLTLPLDSLDSIWSPPYLERLAATYWRFLSRATLGLVHVDYSERERSIVLLTQPLRLLTFHAPEYEMDRHHGLVRWRIARGLLVAKRGRDDNGYLQIEVRRDPGEQDGQVKLQVSVEVANFYPSTCLVAAASLLRRHSVAHPRDRHERLPALAATPRPGRVARRTLPRRTDGLAERLCVARRLGARRRARSVCVAVGRHRRRIGRARLLGRALLACLPARRDLDGGADDGAA